MHSIHAATLYTGTDVLKNKWINFHENEITGITDTPAGDSIGKARVVTPAFIDGHSHIGLIRAGEPGSEAEANDQLDSIIAHADVLDSVQMDDQGFADSIEMGILYSCVLPGSGNIIGGRSAVIRNYGKTSTEALITRAGIKAAFGYNPMMVREWKGTRPYTRMGALSLLRTKLNNVINKMEKEDSQYTAEEMVLRDLLEGHDFLRVHVHKSDDIAALIRLTDEYDLQYTVEHTCDVHDPHIYDILARKNVPVMYGPMDSLAYKTELKHEHWSNIRHLVDSGVRFGLMTDHPVILQKMLMIQLRWFLRIGLNKQQALEIITRQNAEILGIDKVLGTLEKGKWASFICWNGDPFDLTRYPVKVYGEGELLYRA